MTTFTADRRERVIATTIITAISIALPILLGVPEWWAAPVAAVLTAIKTEVGKLIGDPGTASWLPAAPAAGDGEDMAEVQ